MIADIEERVFTALADTTRRRLLATLAQNSPKTATQLAEEFPYSRQNIVKHLGILSEAGLVQARHQGRENRYTFNPEPLHNASAFIETIGAQWDARLQRLKDFVENSEE